MNSLFYLPERNNENRLENVRNSKKINFEVVTIIFENYQQMHKF